MSDFVVKKIEGVDTFTLEQTLNQTLVDDGHVVIDAATKNTYLDKDIHIDLTVPDASEPALSITDLTGSLNMGTATAGVYSPVVSLSGNAAVENAGWIEAGNHAVSDSSVAVGKVNQSTLKNGTTAIASGATIVPEVSASQTINISEGYEGARTVIVDSMDSASTQKAVVNSSNASIATADISIAYDSTNSDFNVTGSKTIAAPTVGTPGFISSTAGTKNSGTATVAIDLDEIALGVSASDKKVTPVLARTAISTSGVIDGASGAGTTTAPSGGVYVKVGAAAVADTITASPVVSAAGYGTAEHSQKTDKTINVGSNAAADLYVPITEGTVAAQGATISSVSVAYDSTAGNFDVTGAANIPAPTASTAGYVGGGAGTLSGLTDGAAVDANLAKIGIAAAISGGDAVTPVISKTGGNVDASAATTTQPSSGFYLTVNTAAANSSVTAAASVTSAGYGTTVAGQYTTAGDSKTITVNAAGATYIPINSGTLANSASSGVTYNDLSSSAPIIPSDGYLYINEGYYADSKISLARLVPDEATITYASGAGYMLSGQTAYDKDGKLVTGTIPTYTGAYTIA